MSLLEKYVLYKITRAVKRRCFLQNFGLVRFRFERSQRKRLDMRSDVDQLYKFHVFRRFSFFFHFLHDLLNLLELDPWRQNLF